MKRTLAVLAAAVAAALAFVLNRTASGERVQIASGDDVLSVAFGGAKEAVSQAMYEEADRYFHGGVDFDHDHDHARVIHVPDPWAWINARIRVPEVERHLEGAKAVELLPWFWAAVRANPKNVEAWASAWYAANTIIGDRTLAARIIKEGREANPDSMELAFCLARFTYDRGRGDLPAAEQAFARAREVGLRTCGGDLARLAARDADTYSFIIDYLADFAERRGERETLASYLDEVGRTGAKTPVADTIRARIRRLAK